MEDLTPFRHTNMMPVHTVKVKMLALHSFSITLYTRASMEPKSKILNKIARELAQNW